MGSFLTHATFSELKTNFTPPWCASTMGRLEARRTVARNPGRGTRNGVVGRHPSGTRCGAGYTSSRRYFGMWIAFPIVLGRLPGTIHDMEGKILLFFSEILRFSRDYFLISCRGKNRAGNFAFITTHYDGKSSHFLLLVPHEAIVPKPLHPRTFPTKNGF